MPKNILQKIASLVIITVLLSSCTKKCWDENSDDISSDTSSISYIVPAGNYVKTNYSIYPSQKNNSNSTIYKNDTTTESDLIPKAGSSISSSNIIPQISSTKQLQSNVYLTSVTGMLTLFNLYQNNTYSLSNMPTIYPENPNNSSANFSQGFGFGMLFIDTTDGPCKNLSLQFTETNNNLTRSIKNNFVTISDTYANLATKPLYTGTIFQQTAPAPPNFDPSGSNTSSSLILTTPTVDLSKYNNGFQLTADSNNASCGTYQVSILPSTSQIGFFFGTQARAHYTTPYTDHISRDASIAYSYTLSGNTKYAQTLTSSDEGFIINNNSSHFSNIPESVDRLDINFYPGDPNDINSNTFSSTSANGVLFFQTQTARNSVGSDLLEKILSSTIGSLANQILKYAEIASNSLYNNLFMGMKKIVISLLTLYVSLSACAYLLGFAKLSQQDLITRVIKIGAVTLLLHNSYFELFTNHNPINTMLFEFFSSSLHSIIGIITQQTGVINTDSAIQAVINKFSNSLSFFFSWSLWFKLLLGMLTGIGIIIIYLVCMLAIKYLYLTLTTLIGFIVCLILLYYLIALAPIFISFILFERTREYFEKWIKAMLTLTLQPILVIIAFTLVNELIVSELDNITKSALCWDACIPVSFDPTTLIPILGEALSYFNVSINIPLPSIYWFTYINFFTLFAAVFILWIYINSFAKILDFCVLLAEKLSIGTFGTLGMMNTSTAGSMIPSTLKQIHQRAKARADNETGNSEGVEDRESDNKSAKRQANTDAFKG